MHFCFNKQTANNTSVDTHLDLLPRNAAWHNVIFKRVACFSPLLHHVFHMAFKFAPKVLSRPPRLPANFTSPKVTSYFRDTIGKDLRPTTPKSHYVILRCPLLPSFLCPRHASHSHFTHAGRPALALLCLSVCPPTSVCSASGGNKVDLGLHCPTSRV